MISPRAVVGNLRFTSDGVYADYMLSGLPFTFLAKGHQELVAAEHAELWRTLPSGATISGLTAPVTTASVAARMLAAHPDLRDGSPADTADADRWISYCRVWEPVIAGARLRRRIYWLSLPLEYGAAGRTRRGLARSWLDTAAGRESKPVVRYRELAADMIAALPKAFHPKPATTQQIWWHWNYVASRGAWDDPLPAGSYDPDASLPASMFSPVYFDESAAALRGRRWRGARTDYDVFLRTFRDPGTGVADSYQVFLPLDSFPDTGFGWPRTAMFKLLEDHVRAGTVLDWTINCTFDSAETAVDEAHLTIKNVLDQYKQRGRRAVSDDELSRTLASGKELASELKRGSERGVNPAIVIAAAAANPDILHELVTGIARKYRRCEVGSRRWRGAQTYLWRGAVPGAERGAFNKEFRNPTTAKRFAPFVPLITAHLGNAVGVPLGVTMTSHGLRNVVLLDFLHCPLRDNEMTLAICGSPGRGKSMCIKNLYWCWLKCGARLHIFDPTDAREHQRALADYDDKVIIDLTRPRFSLDGLRIFPYAEAAERTVDHLLPQLGFAPESQQAHRLKAHLAPENRAAVGIGSTNALIGYLRDLRERHPADDDLLIGLEGLRTDRLLRALFDESLPEPDLAGAQCILWSFAGLPDLPRVDEHYQAHLHKMTTPGQRAAAALYALGADYAQSIAFADP
ncbi:MAG: ATP-binding protein, partial [Mycolicibacterium sp.]|nr:ATP-binding protein [Mycolicibacterium sp.]